MWAETQTAYQVKYTLFKSSSSHTCIMVSCSGHSSPSYQSFSLKLFLSSHIGLHNMAVWKLKKAVFLLLKGTWPGARPCASESPTINHPATVKLNNEISLPISSISLFSLYLTRPAKLKPGDVAFLPPSRHTVLRQRPLSRCNCLFLKTTIKDLFMPHQQNLLRESDACKEMLGGGPDVDQNTAVQGLDSPQPHPLNLLCSFNCPCLLCACQVIRQVNSHHIQKGSQSSFINVLNVNSPAPVICKPAMMKTSQSQISDPVSDCTLDRVCWCSCVLTSRWKSYSQSL